MDLGHLGWRDAAGWLAPKKVGDEVLGPLAMPGDVGHVVAVCDSRFANDTTHTVDFGDTIYVAPSHNLYLIDWRKKVCGTDQCPCETCRAFRERFSVYICRGRSGALYTGISTDPVRRVREHNGSRRGAKWARSQRPIKLLWQEGPFSKSVALKFERKLKSLTRQQKLKFLKGDFPVEIPK